MSSLDTRLRRLEGSSLWRDAACGGETFTVDICADPPRYWIDGREVSRQEFEQGAPQRGPFTVEIGDSHAPERH